MKRIFIGITQNEPLLERLPVRERTWLWIGAVIFSAAMALAVLLSPLANVYPQISVELNVASHRDVEVFFDLGKGFGADFKILFPPQPGRLARFQAPIPWREIKSLRVDAGEPGDILLIGSVELISLRKHEILSGMQLEDRIVQTNGLGRLELRGDTIAGVVENDDPFVVCIPEDLRVYPRILPEQIGLALAVIILAGGAFAFTVFAPGSSIIFFFSFTFLFILQKIFSLHQFHLYTLLGDPLLLPTISLGLWGATLFTWGFNRYSNNTHFSRQTFYPLYRSFLIALGVLFIGFYLEPAFCITAISCAVLVIAYSGGQLSVGVHRAIEGMVGNEGPGAASVDRHWKILLFVVILALVITRAPALLIDPRMWAEDGGHTLVSLASIHDWTAFFWYVEYFRIFSNIAGLLSTRLFDIEYAAHVFTFIALAGKTVPFVIVIFGRSHLWDTAIKKVVVCILILYAPMSAEIWLNVNGLHYYMTLATILLLPEIESAARGLRRFFYFVLLGAAGLSGVLPCVLTPLYALRALQIRNRNLCIALLILGCALLFQMYMKFSFAGIVPRGSAASTEMAGWIVVIKTILLPLNGDWAQLGYIISQRAPLVPGGLSSGQLLLAGYVAGCLCLLWVLRKTVAAYFVLAGLMLIIIALLFAIGGPEQHQLRDPFLGNRYFYVSNVVFLIAMVLFFQEISNYFRASVVAAVLFFCLGFVLSNSMSLFYNEQVVLDDLPSWRSEISKWRNDPEHKIMIWPQGWSIYL